MRHWAMQDANARFAEMLDACLADGPQVVSQRGEAKAVLVPIEEWTAMKASSKPTLKDILLAGGPDFELEMPERERFTGRPLPDFD